MTHRTAGGFVAQLIYVAVIYLGIENDNRSILVVGAQVSQVLTHGPELFSVFSGD